MGSLPAQMDCSDLPNWATWVDHSPEHDSICSVYTHRLDHYMGITFAVYFGISHVWFVSKVVPLL
jgi:hypothetical protein